MTDRTVQWSRSSDPTSWSPDPGSGVFECQSPWDYIWPNLPGFGWHNPAKTSRQVTGQVPSRMCEA